MMKHNCCLVRTYHNNGNISEECFINNEKKEGICKIFDDHNNLKCIINYINGLRNGYCRIYNDSDGFKFYINDKIGDLKRNK